MTSPRKQLISLDDTPYYHCVGRCVRRAFLCGTEGGVSYEHRRGWITDRVKQLASVFTIDIAAYAVMSNHYHLVLRIDRERAKALSDTQVIKRWLILYKGPDIIRQHLRSPFTDKPRLALIHNIVDQWRSRLHDLSWFMGNLNEYIAKRANAEDKCTGHFWESRFKSQALLDEIALFSCMAYVDLNPIRAGMATTSEGSNFTSIQERLGITPHNRTDESEKPKTKSTNNATLMPFSGSIKANTPNDQLPFNFKDYIELVDWTGRIIQDDKRGSIPNNTPPILHRLNINPEQWLKACPRIEKDYYRAIGPVATLQEFANRLEQRWLKGVIACRRLYTNKPA